MKGEVKRPLMITFRVSEEERKDIEVAAEALGLEISAFCRTKALKRGNVSAESILDSVAALGVDLDLLRQKVLSLLPDATTE